MTMQWYKTAAVSEPSDTPVDLFESREWALVMEGLGARCWHGVDRENGARVGLFVWQKGPAKVGYLGFPVTPAWASSPSSIFDVDNLPERVHLLRTNTSMLDSDSVRTTASIGLPECVIPSLENWPVRNAKKVQKDLAFAARHGVVVRNATDQDVDTITSIYLETIARQHGRLRYNRDYFSALIALSCKSGQIQVRMACHENRAIGFCVTAMQSRRGYYLHAGVSEHCRQFGAADLLANDSIRWIISCGGESFSLMASPQKQPGLQKFKQKWSEADGEWVVSERSFGLVGTLISAVLKRA